MEDNTTKTVNAVLSTAGILKIAADMKAAGVPEVQLLDIPALAQAKPLPVPGYNECACGRRISVNKTTCRACGE